MIDKLKQQKRQNLVIHAFALILFSFLGAYILQHFIFAAPQNVSVPSSILQCSADPSAKNEAPALTKFLSSLSSDTTVNFPNNGCYYTQSIVEIQDAGQNGITINGNGTQFTRTVSNDQNSLALSNWDPYMALVQNNGININGFTINGTYNGDPTAKACVPPNIITNCFNGGDLNEAHTGIYLEANNGATLNQMTFNNVEGDCLSIMFPQKDLLTFNSNVYPWPNLNYGITVTNSTFSGCGYMGLSIESACGVTIANNHFNNMFEDAIDFEVDGNSTGFSNPIKALPANCNYPPTKSFPNGMMPLFVAEDNINIANNYWKNYGYDWFTSQQGEYPGIQEDNVTLTGNILQGGGPKGLSGMKINVKATPLNQTSAPYWFNGLTITNNVSQVRTTDLFGGAPPRSPALVGYSMLFQNVANLNISGNISPINDGYPNYFYNIPYIGALAANGELSGTMEGGTSNAPIVKNNNFTGGYDVFASQDSSNNAAINTCGNTYWVNNSRTDNTCGATTAPSVPTSVKAVANSFTSVDVSWSASTDSGGPGLGGYYVFRGGNKIATVGASSTSYTDNNVLPNTTYTYTVEAYDSNNPPDVSAPSTPASVTTPGLGGPTKPSTPTNLKANVDYTYDVNLAWSASTDKGGPGLGGYYIFRDGNKYAQVGVTSSTSFTDRSVTKYATYTYQVEAYDTSGNVSSLSSPVTVEVIPGPVILPGGPKVPPPIIIVTPNSKATLCIPPGIDITGVSSVTFTIGSETFTTVPGQLCTTFSTIGLATGTHTVYLTLANQNGTTSNYQEKLNIKSANWFSHSRYWLAAIILLVLLVLDIAWMYIRPNHKSHKSFLKDLASQPVNNLPVPPTVVTPHHKKHSTKK